MGQNSRGWIRSASGLFQILLAFGLAGWPALEAATYPGSRHDLVSTGLARSWDEGVPLGNGLLGALVWQKGSSLRLSLDRADLWDLRHNAAYQNDPNYSYAGLLRLAAEGRWDEARRWYSQALESDPASTQAHNGLGVVEMKAGHRQAAIQHWQEAVARDPENFDALYNVATELLNDGRPDVARPYLEQFVRTAPPALYAAEITRVRGLLARMGK